MIDIRITFVKKDSDVGVVPIQTQSVGETLIAFIKELHRAKGPIRVIAMLPQQIMTREALAVGACHVSYEGSEEDLRPFREALWYYTRHPHRRPMLDETDHRKLVQMCEKYRWEMRREAQTFTNADDADLETLWRRALLFAVRVKDARDISRALRLKEETFEDLIALRIEDEERSISFSDLLAEAETSAPA